MHADARPSLVEWTGALVAALLLHVALATGLPSTGTTQPDTARHAGSGNTARVRLSLGSGPSQAPRPAPRDAQASPPQLGAAPRPALPKPPRTRAPAEETASAHSQALVEAPLPEPPPTPPAPAAVAPNAVPAAGAVGTGAAAVAGVSAGPSTASAEAGSAQRGSGASAPATAGAAKTDYFGGVVEQVSSALRYPRRARLERLQGSVVLAIRIGREGELERCEVLESSGSRLLDREALRSAARAAPFGAVPNQLSDADLDFELPLDFVLTD